MRIAGHLKQLWFIIPLLATVHGISSCSSSNTRPPDWYINIETSGSGLPTAPIRVSVDGDKYTFSVKSNTYWGITPEESYDWIRVDKSAVYQDGSVTVTVDDAYLLIGERTAKFVFTINSEEKASVVFVQDGIDVDFKVSPMESDLIPANGGDASLTITTPEKWTYRIENGTWLTQTDRTNNSLEFTANLNPGAQVRTAQIIFSVEGYDATLTALIRQQGRQSNAPAADMLDVFFNADGTATNLAESGVTIEAFPNNNLEVIYSDRFERYIARFSPPEAGAGTPTNDGFFKAYYSTNQAFKDALADGHTLEAVVMSNINDPIPNNEIKFFASHNQGGTGLMLRNPAGTFTFLPNLGGWGGSWTESDVTPVKGKYYHIVGVWNKEQSKIYCYVNGVLKATTDNSNNYNPNPDADQQFFGIGADPAGGGAFERPWIGDVVIARVYDDPLTQAQVTELWKEVQEAVEAP